MQRPSEKEGSSATLMRENVSMIFSQAPALINEAKQTGPQLWPTQRTLCERPRATVMAANASSRQRKWKVKKGAKETGMVWIASTIGCSPRSLSQICSLLPYISSHNHTFLWKIGRVSRRESIPTSRSSSDRARLRRFAERRLDARFPPIPQNLEPCQREGETNKCLQSSTEFYVTCFPLTWRETLGRRAKPIR